MAFHQCRGGPAAALPWVIKRALRWHLQHSEGFADGLVRPPDAGDAEPRLAPFREHPLRILARGSTGMVRQKGFLFLAAPSWGLT